MADETPETRARYRHFLPIQTRWMDNDVYGHVNNVTYYSYFDSVVNEYLIRAGGLDFTAGEVIGVVAASMCRFIRSLTFPEIIEAGLRVRKLGNSSVRYEIAIFAAGADEPAATGHFVHVFVDRETMRPAPMPAEIRNALEHLSLPGTA
jgi:acyl-CoA thioester hydrolase